MFHYPSRMSLSKLLSFSDINSLYCVLSIMPNAVKKKKQWNTGTSPQPVSPKLGDCRHSRWNVHTEQTLEWTLTLSNQRRKIAEGLLTRETSCCRDAALRQDRKPICVCKHWGMYSSGGSSAQNHEAKPDGPLPNAAAKLPYVNQSWPSRPPGRVGSPPYDWFILLSAVVNLSGSESLLNLRHLSLFFFWHRIGVSFYLCMSVIWRSTSRDVESRSRLGLFVGSSTNLKHLYLTTWEQKQLVFSFTTL